MIHKITLLELNKSIQDTLKDKFSDPVWIVAEISELKVNRNGHCYIELIEKDVLSDNIIAKTRATIWAFTFRMLKPYFENATGQELSPGLKILIQANIEFHELFGLSLNIKDIDPSYTIGDLAIKKREIIKKLEDDGIIDMNKELEFPILPQRIAVISSETAAGYQDFINQITQNNYRFKFYLKLFPSIMQGVNAEESIISSLENIYKHEHLFDAVVIIRGGGAQSDLSCFDSYTLASNIAQFPLPVLTGIGHDKDESISDIVAYKKLKTPTAVAEFILNKAIELNNILDSQKETINNSRLNYFENLNIDLINLTLRIKPVVEKTIHRNEFDLKLISKNLEAKSKTILNLKNSSLLNYSRSIKSDLGKNIRQKNYTINSFKNQIEHKLKLHFQRQTLLLKNNENRVDLLDPLNILKRGYSITYKNGQRVKSINKLFENDIITTKLFDGEISSVVNKKE
ncbi:MAG: exodeoxyribonuclease VII large subunit [Bacteroidales bacterium]|nr:exodeoxyribonuclease VII large subunit [Bacteroidales bacterium]